MTNYGTLEKVKSLLQVKADEGTTWDTEINECIVSGDAIALATLTKSGLTLPETVPQLFVDAANNYAAWLFRRKRDPEAAKQFFLDAESLMQRYIDSVNVSSALRSGKVVTRRRHDSLLSHYPFDRWCY